MQETRTNDIHCLNLESWTWSEMYVAMCHCYTVPCHVMYAEPELTVSFYVNCVYHAKSVFQNPVVPNSGGEIMAHTHSSIRQHLVPVWRSEC